MSTTVIQVTYGDDGHAPLTSARPTHTYTGGHNNAHNLTQILLHDLMNQFFRNNHSLIHHIYALLRPLQEII